MTSSVALRQVASARVAVLVNPQAGSSEPDRGELESVLGGRAWVAEVADRDALVRFVAELRERRTEVVCVCGGDGTLGRVVTALVTELGGDGMPAVAPIGGGTMNTIARSLGLPRAKPAQLLRAVVGDEGRLRRRRQATMSINRERVGFMFGAGVPARFLQLYERGKQLGPVRAARVLGQLIGSALVGGRSVRDLFASVGGRVSIDGADVGLHRVSLVYAAVIDDIGLGFRPTPRAAETSGGFEVLAADARPGHLIRALPRLRFGDGIGGDPWIDLCGRNLSIELEEAMVYMVDGDVEAPVRQLEVASGPVIDVLVADRPR